MADTVWNPVVWLANRTLSAGNHLVSITDAVRTDGEKFEQALPKIRDLEMEDIQKALEQGLNDFTHCRSDVMGLAILYPMIGLFLVWSAFDRNVLPLLFPIMSGFALIGPVAASGLYEMSRQTELGREVSWRDAFGVVRSPSFGAIFVLGLFLFLLFFLWMIVAHGVYSMTLGPEAPDSLAAFIMDTLTTGAGWTMTIVGMGAGAIFAGIVLAISVVSFPLLLDRNVGVSAAVVTSIRVTMRNPRPILAWGFTVAALLAIGSIPAFLGLIVILPVLGHATWHLYRAAIVPEGG